MLKEEGRRKKEEGRRKREEGSGVNLRLKPTIPIVFLPKIDLLWE